MRSSRDCRNPRASGWMPWWRQRTRPSMTRIRHRSAPSPRWLVSCSVSRGRGQDRAAVSHRRASARQPRWIGPRRTLPVGRGIHLGGTGRREQGLAILTFRSNNRAHRPVIEALNWLRANRDDRRKLIPCAEIPLDGVVTGQLREVLTCASASPRHSRNWPAARYCPASSCRNACYAVSTGRAPTPA